MANSNERNGRIIVAIVGVILVSALGYFVVKSYQQGEQNEENVARIDELNTEILELEDDIKSFKQTIEDQSLALEEKDILLAGKDKELQTLRDRLNRLKKSGQAKTKEFEETISQLEYRINDLQNTVTSYRAQVKELESENLELTVKVDSLADVGAQLEQDKADLTKSNEDKQNQLDMAAVLKAAEFRFISVSKKGKEKEEKSFRKGALDDLKVCFTLMENPVAVPGPREIYMVYENPDNTVTTNTEGSYSGTFTHDGKTLNYSAKATVAYNRLSKEVCITYARPEADKYQKGNQYISIYCDGSVIGRSYFEIR